jgi:transposase
LDQRFDEDDLCDNLDWLAAHQEAIENRLFADRHASPPPSLFLYDVTSSYLEGDRNELADWGYNRDKKRGKKQIVIGMLCDQDGEPVSTAVFEGNTSDLATFESQIHKTAERFGCQRVTFVGDRGMIKSGQIEDLSRAGFHYITAITKAQIRSLIKKDVIQLGLFDEKLCEAVQDGVRYILRRNPVRAEELAASRASKLETLRKLAQKQNEYLIAHPKADPQRSWKLVSDKQSKLDVASWVTVRVEEGRIVVEVDEERLGEIQLDGCYALKTDLPRDAADPETIHARYKDLALVEMGFRTMKTDHLRVRPVWVRKESRTRAHVLVVMLAYRLIRELSRAWSGMDLKVEEGLDHLKRLCAMELKVKNGATCLRLPTPDDLTHRLLEALDIGLPAVLPAHAPKADSRKKRPSRRKSL